MLHLLDHTPDRLRAWLAERELPAYRAAQVRRWVFQQRAATFDEMSDLSKSVRRLLADEFRIFTSQIVQHETADDGTEKLLLELSDREHVECVLLRDDKGHHTICISTQVGCAMGCAFCASGLGGLVRNLSCGEIVEQMLQLQRLLTGDCPDFRAAKMGLSPSDADSRAAKTGRPRSARISHVVVMGIGEPLANLDALLPALATATSPDALGISARRITISTVGLPQGIRRLAEANCPYHLAVSLHAADDALRNRLVPTNRTMGLTPILAAADEYFDKTGRRVTFEYVLLAQQNDQPEHARRLVTLLRGRPALVNVIPYNPVPELPYRTPDATVTARFVEILRQGNLNVKVRYRKGARIAAACGQLRRTS